MKLAGLTSAALICSLALAPAAAAQTAKAAPEGCCQERRRPGHRAGPAPSAVAGAREGKDAAARERVRLSSRSSRARPKVVGGELRNTPQGEEHVGLRRSSGLRVDADFYIGQKEAAVGSGKMPYGARAGRDRGDHDGR